MKLTTPKNSNYCATVVKIKTIVQLKNCDNVQAAVIMGNQVIIDKSININDVGLYFPIECRLSEEYLKANNLYRKPELNSDVSKKGYFEENGRVRCVKFRDNKSEGIFMPLSSLNSIEGLNLNLNEFSVNDIFDEINGIPICQKYIVINNRTPSKSSGGSKKNKKAIKSKIIENQFRFHDDTSMLFRNLHRFNENSLIHISYKIHGTSAIASKLLCKKPLKWYEKVLKMIGLNIVDTHYDYVYASRKVIKNEDMNSGFYACDIWKNGFDELKDFLEDGMTIYYEIAGFLPNGAYIQPGYDYGHSLIDHSDEEIRIGDQVVKIKSNKPFKSGNKINTVKGIINHPELNIPAYTFEEDDSYVECQRCYKYKPGKPFGIYIYRITYTNPSGKVYEFSAPQVQQWCKKNGLGPVPELFYGKVSDLIKEFSEEKFLNEIKSRWNDHKCFICKNDVPEDGCVVRLEGKDFEAYKVKSSLFYEYETKLLDQNVVDIEESN